MNLTLAGAAGQAMLGLHGALSLLGAGMRGKPRRGMLRRAVFSDFQRKGLEKVFQKQKYISKPDRKKLAEKLGLKDSQVFTIAISDRSHDLIVDVLTKTQMLKKRFYVFYSGHVFFTFFDVFIFPTFFIFKNVH